MSLPLKDPQIYSHTLSSPSSVSPTHSFVRPISESNLCSPTFPSFSSLLLLLQVPLSYYCILGFPSSKKLPDSIIPLLCYSALSLLFSPKLGLWAVKREGSMTFCSMDVEHRALSWTHVQVSHHRYLTVSDRTTTENYFLWQPSSFWKLQRRLKILVCLTYHTLTSIRRHSEKEV